MDVSRLRKQLIMNVAQLFLQTKLTIHLSTFYFILRNVKPVKFKSINVRKTNVYLTCISVSY